MWAGGLPGGGRGPGAIHRLHLRWGLFCSPHPWDSTLAGPLVSVSSCELPGGQWMQVSVPDLCSCQGSGLSHRPHSEFCLSFV